MKRQSQTRIRDSTSFFVFFMLLTLLLHNVVVAQEVTPVNAVSKRLSFHAIPLSRPDVDSFADLHPLKKVFRGVRVIGLGEATHGTHEFFQFKSRTFKFLIKELNFKVLALETGYAAASEINDYVAGKSNDSAKALRDQGFWPFDTKEMLNLLEWMRAYNQTSPSTKKVKVVGFDIHYNKAGKPPSVSFKKSSLR